MTTPSTDFIALQAALAGQYSLERELGRGGMGIVYLARDVSLERLVAIKVLPRELAANRARRERFLREARTAAQLSHPHIVPIHHVGEAGDTVFFVMAYVDGETLGSRLRARGAMPVSQAMRVVREVAWALAYAHLRGIVHRDVKPDNILLERDSGRALIMDFGIARASTDDPLLDDVERFGTAQYVSPEQAAGATVDARSDVYSLGIVAWQAVAGTLPFSGDPLELLEQHLRVPPPPLVTRAPAVPHAVARTIERCLEKDPSRRWSTAEALADSLGAALGPTRELPPALRVWLTRSEFPVLPVAASSVYMVPVVIALTMVGGPAIPVVALAGLTSVMFGPLVFHTRRALRAGYSYDDLRAALRLDLERHNEEMAIEYGPHAGRSGLRGPLALTAGSGAVFGLMLGIMSNSVAVDRAAVPVFALVSGLLVSGYFVARGIGRVVQQLIDGQARMVRVRLWEGPWGKRIAKLAGWKLGARGEAAQALNQPTEIALVSSAERLFAALPKPVRRTLCELPAVVKQLEGNARAMREQIALLDRQLLEIDAAPVRGHDLAALASDVRTRRTDAAARLREAVTALETIRLDLLRLQAPGADAAPVTASLTGSLTATLAAANALGDEVRLLADARAEVERALRTGALPSARERERNRPITPITPIPST